MCLSVPGRITKIAGTVATVDYGAETRQALLIESGFNIGDYVIVKGRVIVERVPAKRAKEWLETIEGKTTLG